MKTYYFDNAATSRAFKEVGELLSKLMTDEFGNASSLHGLGVNAAKRVGDAKASILNLIGGDLFDVIFTSGGTEANNLAILGSAPKNRRKCVVISSLEHSSVTESAAHVGLIGGEVRIVKPQPGGVVNPADVLKAVDENCAIVSIVHVAGELGTVQPVFEIAKAVKKKNPKTRVHIDAVQAAGSLPRLDYPDFVDMVTISAHKFHGPQGVGALLVRPHISLKPMFFGGDQQKGIRPGTLNMPAIAGMGLAAQITAKRRFESSVKTRLSADLFRDLILCEDGVRVLGSQEHRSPGIIIAAVAGTRSEVLLHTMEIEGVYASAGSACHSSRTNPSASYVDEGLRDDEGVIRFSIGDEYSNEEIEAAADIFIRSVKKVRVNRA
ncbi:MAG: cysteine desulfurase, partial [Deltaproteobacteria bacterium]|nr:cysteine desulfurase [Deltaproteobacteria bacterium]